MKKISSLTELFVEQIKELYDSERKQQDVFQKFIKSARSNDLKKLMLKIAEQTDSQVMRLEEVLELLGEPLRGVECKPMKELLARSLSLSRTSANPEILETSLIAAIQCAKHFEIAVYGTLVAFAESLGDNESADILARTLAEEKALDNELTELAMESINSRAKESEPAAYAF